MSRYYSKNYDSFYCDIQGLHSEVTGSCILCVVRLPSGEKIKFIVDCGLFQEREYEDFNKNFPFKASEIDFVLITHVHVDHIGRLPMLARKGYTGKYYASEDTCKLLPLSIRDSGRIVADKCKANNEEPLYEIGDIDSLVSNLQPVVARRLWQPHKNVYVTALRNNHLVGAFSYLVQIKYKGYEDINILFTGDLKEHNVFLEKTCIPKWILKLPLTIVTESTYGNEEKTGGRVFAKNVAEALKQGGTVVAPVISLGRTQEVLYVLKKLQKDGRISPKIPIYLDGKLAIAYTKLYKNGTLKSIKKSMRDFLPENLHLIIDGDKKAMRRDIKADSSPKIILASSGMGTYGSSASYIQHFIQLKNALIHFCCYCAENTVGRKLKEANEGTEVEVCGLVVEKKAEVKFTDEFSGHAHERELMKYLSKFKNIKLLVINHGEDEAKRKLARDAKVEISPKDIFILDRENAVRTNHFGFEKSFRTKF